MYPTHCVFQDLLSKQIIGHGTKRDGLYYFDELKIGKTCLTESVVTDRKNKVMLWHKRLGHPSFGYLKKLSPHLFIGINDNELSCKTCVEAKSHRVSYHDSVKNTSVPFDLIHTDVWGPSPVVTKNGSRWYVSFIDECTRMTWLYLLKHKDEVAKTFQDFYNMVETQFGTRIKMVRSDNGTEYVNKNLKNFFNEKGILHETSCVNTPQQNGVAERKNRHLLEITRSILFESKVPTYFWDNAITFATYLINRIPTKINNYKTPLQVLSQHHNIPSILNLPPRIFGCTVFVHIQKTHRTKLEANAVKCVFLGFNPFQKGYKCFNPSTRRFYTSMDVTFFENEFYYDQTTVLGQGEIRDDQNLCFLNSPQPTLEFGSSTFPQPISTDFTQPTFSAATTQPSYAQPTSAEPTLTDQPTTQPSSAQPTSTEPALTDQPGSGTASQHAEPTQPALTNQPRSGTATAQPGSGTMSAP